MSKREERSLCLSFFFFFSYSDTHARTHLTIDLVSSHTLIHHILGHTQAYFLVGQRSAGAAIIAVPEQQRTKRSGSVAVGRKTTRALKNGTCDVSKLNWLKSRDEKKQNFVSHNIELNVFICCEFTFILPWLYFRGPEPLYSSTLLNCYSYYFQSDS